MQQVRGVMVTVRAPANSNYDFLSRYFAPWNGIPEDPVTGTKIRGTRGPLSLSKSGWY